MFLTIILFIIGFILLIKGADIMVDGSSSIAKRYGISTFVIGLTIVAFGTSAPEMVVSILASIRESSGIALGNIIGSNISNTLLILGVSAIVAPLVVKKATVNKEIPFSLLAVFALLFLANDIFIDRDAPNGLTRIDGLILILFFVIFIYYTFGISKEKENRLTKIAGAIKGEEEPKEYSILKSTLMIVLGLAGLIIGGRWIVNGAVELATLFGLSENLIGLTIVAVGTSLPELAASAMAAYRGKTDLAVGNVVGSNIFNILWVLGISSVINTIGYNASFNIDMIILIGVTILLLILIYVGRRNVIGSWEGATLVSIYIFYIIYLIIRG